MAGLHREIGRSLDQDKQILELAGGTGDDTLYDMEAVEGDGQTTSAVFVVVSLILSTATSSCGPKACSSLM